MMQIVKALRSGQITIPSSFRDKLGIDEETLLQVRLVEKELRIKPIKIAGQSEDATWLKKLYDHFAPVRKEASKYSEGEVNKVIDRAVRAVRSAKHAKSRI